MSALQKPVELREVVQQQADAQILDLYPRQEGGDFFNGDTSPDITEVNWVRETAFIDAQSGHERIRRTGFLTVDDHQHLVRVSEPDPSLVSDVASARRIFLMPGWTEMIDSGTAKNLHDEVAQANPTEVIASIATDGVSVHGHALSYRAAIGRSFEDMADARRRIMSNISGDAEAAIIGTSMGAVLAVLTARQNLSAPAAERILIQRLVLLNPGLIASHVPKEERFRKSLDSTIGRLSTFAAFVGHMSVDGPREGLRHPRQAAEAAAGFMHEVAAMRKDPDKATAILGNLLQLMEGTPWEDIKHVARHYTIDVRSGKKDTLREEAQYRALQKLFPHHVHLDFAPGKGHAMSLDARTVAQSIRSARTNTPRSQPVVQAAA